MIFEVWLRRCQLGMLHLVFVYEEILVLFRAFADYTSLLLRRMLSYYWQLGFVLKRISEGISAMTGCKGSPFLREIIDADI